MTSAAHSFTSEHARISPGLDRQTEMGRTSNYVPDLSRLQGQLRASFGPVTPRMKYPFSGKIASNLTIAMVRCIGQDHQIDRTKMIQAHTREMHANLYSGSEFTNWTRTCSKMRGGWRGTALKMSSNIRVGPFTSR